MRLSILILWPKRCEADSLEDWFYMQSRDRLKLDSDVDDDYLLYSLSIKIYLNYIVISHLKLIYTHAFLSFPSSFIETKPNVVLKAEEYNDGSEKDLPQGQIY